MNTDEKLQAATVLRERGNGLFKVIDPAARTL
jgi:hypothetical protein